MKPFSAEGLPAPNRLSDQVADFLRGQIYRGELAPGDRITETELSRRLNVSRAPVREALAVLKREGMIDTPPYRAAVVARLSEGDLVEIQEIRVALESLAARTAALSRSDEFLVALHTAYEGMLAALAASDSTAAAVSHLGFHRAIAVESGFERVTTILDQLAVRSLALQGWAGLSPAELEGPVQDHLKIIEAFESGDPAAAEAAVAENIRAPNLGIRRLLQRGSEA